jgi:hypothetical protein
LTYIYICPIIQKTCIYFAKKKCIYLQYYFLTFHQTYREHLLNRLPFDCSGKRAKNEDDSCLADAIKVKQMLNEAVKRATISLFYELREKIKELNTGPYSMAHLLCFGRIRHDILTPSFINLLELNDTQMAETNYSVSLTVRLADIVGENFLMADRNVSQIASALNSIGDGLDDSHNVTMEYQDCTRKFRTSDKASVSAILAAHVMLSRNSSFMPLGTFLRMTRGHIYLRDEVREKLDNYLDLHVSSEPKATDLIKFNFLRLFGKYCCLFDKNHRTGDTGCANCNATTFNRDRIQKEATVESMLTAVTFALQPFTHHMREEAFDEMASAVAKDLGLDDDNLNNDRDMTHPTVWHCKNKAMQPTVCPKFQFTYTDAGIGYSFNMGSWAETFNAFNLNSVVDNGDDDDNGGGYKANDELHLYLYQPIKTFGYNIKIYVHIKASQ